METETTINEDVVTNANNGQTKVLEWIQVGLHAIVLVLALMQTDCFLG